MKKLIMVVVAGMMLCASQAFAGNGDLIVDGRLGVGTVPTAPFMVVSPGSGQIFAGPSTSSYIFAGYDGGSYGRIGVWSNNFYQNLAINEGGGYVGIGTIAPKTKLAVTGAVSATGIAGYDEFGTGTVIGGDGTNALVYARKNSEWAPMFIDSKKLYLNAQQEQPNGTVLIGTMTDPGGYKLVVKGDTHAEIYWATSDERYKKNIVPVQNALNKLLMLEGVSYEWKKPEEYSTPAVVQASPATAGIAADSISARMIQPETKNFPEGRQYGVLAQAVEVVLPEVVKTDSIGDKAVNYAGIIPVLIEAIKEQQKLIEKQQMEIMEIKNSFH